MKNIFTDMKVFIVDDLETMRTEISMYLNQLGCDKIEFAKDGQEAWDILVEKTRLGDTYDLIISDIKMPEMDGLSLLENAKQLSGTSSIPFLVVSTESELPTIMGAIKLGADNYIVKPFSKIELENKIKRIFRIRT
jgi:two-component system chemotaxis response regulator CheY